MPQNQAKPNQTNSCALQRCNHATIHTCISNHAYSKDAGVAINYTSPKLRL